MVSEKMGPIQPWWRIRMVWLALGGPAVVVVASFITLAYAIHGRDRPLLEGTVTSADSDAPAAQARNHVVSAKP
ncbi:MAG: hypothetical protein ABI702_21165 [Burkholderiales bacterium]